MDIRVRFAPSPTGYLHIGGARTALFNWLFARGQGGKFILRIEDTDLARSTEESVNVIINDLKWLGLDWDEGPFKQSERLDRYKEVADALTQKGLLYECFCTKEELEARRTEALRNKMPPRYDRRCLGLSEEQKEAHRREGRRPALRYKVADEGEVIIEDLVRGTVKFLNKDIGDLIFVRADGMPTYNFVVAVDDHDMGITHVIRGEDHLSNTPKQIYIYEAMGWERPQFGHLSLILGADRVPLSKRHAAVAVDDFKKRGFIAKGMVNFLALLGWSFDDQATIFTLDELVEKFSLERVNKSGAIFDYQKLLWINGEHIRRSDTKELTELALPFIREAGLVGEDLTNGELERLEQMVSLCRDRVNLLPEIPGFITYFFEDPEPAVAELLEKVPLEKVPVIVRDCLAMFSHCKALDSNSIENTVAAVAENLGVKTAWIYQTLRVYITGKMVTPPLNPSMLLLGRDVVVRRLEAAHRSLGV